MDNKIYDVETEVVSRKASHKEASSEKRSLWPAMLSAWLPVVIGALALLVFFSIVLLILKGIGFLFGLVLLYALVMWGFSVVKKVLGR